jgi:hypothetical protein
MWRIIIFLLYAQLIFAGSIEIHGYTFNIKENTIIKMGSVTSTWSSPEKNRAVFEIKLDIKGGVSYGVSEGNHMYYTLQAATKTEIVPFSRPAFNKRIRFIIDDDDKSITSDYVIFRFEETKLVDSSKNLFSINYFALNKKEMHEEYGKTKKGFDLNKIDSSGEIKMIISESEDQVSYCVFFFHEQTPTQPAEAEKVYNNVHSQISAPFVYAIQYKNYYNTMIFDNVSQDTPFTIPVAEWKDNAIGDNSNFTAELFCIILPQKYDNEKLIAEIRLMNRLKTIHLNTNTGAQSDDLYVKTIEFEKDDIIQFKLPSYWPGTIYKSPTGYLLDKRPVDKNYEAVFDPDVKEQSITIRPIKIQ